MCYLLICILLHSLYSHYTQLWQAQKIKQVCAVQCAYMYMYFSRTTKWMEYSDNVFFLGSTCVETNMWLSTVTWILVKYSWSACMLGRIRLLFIITRCVEVLACTPWSSVVHFNPTIGLQCRTLLVFSKFLVDVANHSHNYMWNTMLLCGCQVYRDLYVFTYKVASDF